MNNAAAMDEVDKKERIKVQPKPGMKYIYNLNMVWKDGVLGHIPVESGVMVENVRLEAFGKFVFNTVGEVEELHCYYGWAFVEDTPENRARYLAYLKAQLAAEEAGKIRDAAFAAVVTLEETRP